MPIWRQCLNSKKGFKMNKLLSRLIVLIFSFAMTGSAFAIPKAAEDASASVTSGADAPKPRKTKATNSNPVEKKSAHKAKRHPKNKHGKAR
jgi:hypothetical protein